MIYGIQSLEHKRRNPENNHKLGGEKIMLIKLNKNRAQSITEYAVLMGVLVLAIVLTQVYVKRSIQSKFKSTADDIGEQFTTGQNYSTQTIQQSAREEKSGVGTATTGGELELAWSKSTIAATSSREDPRVYIPADWTGVDTAGPKLHSYAGREVTQKDYVDQNVGANVVAPHGIFDSAILQNEQPLIEATRGARPTDGSATAQR